MLTREFLTLVDFISRWNSASLRGWSEDLVAHSTIHTEMPQSAIIRTIGTHGLSSRLTQNSPFSPSATRTARLREQPFGYGGLLPFAVVIRIAAAKRKRRSEQAPPQVGRSVMREEVRPGSNARHAASLRVDETIPVLLRGQAFTGHCRRQGSRD
jgi:hypothetical protein